MCKPKEWDRMPDEFDNTWGIVKEFGGSSVSFSCSLISFSHVFNTLLFFVFQLKSVQR